MFLRKRRRAHRLTPSSVTTTCSTQCTVAPGERRLAAPIARGSGARWTRRLTPEPAPPAAGRKDLSLDLDEPALALPEHLERGDTDPVTVLELARHLSKVTNG